MIFESKYGIGQKVMVPDPNLTNMLGGEMTYSKVRIVGVSWSCNGDLVSKEAALITYQTEYLTSEGKHVVYHVREDEIEVIQ